MTPRALLAWGIVLAFVAVALAALGGALKGPANPECAGFSAFAPGCRDARTASGLAVQLLGLPVAIASGTLVAMWLGRRAQADEEP